MEKRNGDKFSPCLTPVLHEKKTELTSAVEILDFILLYKSG